VAEHEAAWSRSAAADHMLVAAADVRSHDLQNGAVLAFAITLARASGSRWNGSRLYPAPYRQRLCSTTWFLLIWPLRAMCGDAEWMLHVNPIRGPQASAACKESLIACKG
jgi:hypothetical protein